MFARVARTAPPTPRSSGRALKASRIGWGDGRRFAGVLSRGPRQRPITLWDSEQALTASVAQADAIRKESPEAGGGSIESVEHYEIGLTVGGP